MRICRVATVPFFLQHHLRAQIRATVDAGHDVTLVSGDGPEVVGLKELSGVRFEQIDIPRTVSLWRDCRALWELFLLFRKERYDIVHSTTPKAGMLCAIAGAMARIPIRMHTYTGQPWMELSGPLRWVAKTGDWLTARLNTMNYADSFSQRDFLITQGVVQMHKISVIGAGSLAGVDSGRFDLARWRDKVSGLRKQLGIAESAVLITFVGRLTRDKGMSELIQAFVRLERRQDEAMLLLVGPQEPERDPLPQNVLRHIREHPSILEIGYSNEPEKYLAMTDIFCLPSYREGFPNVVIEAAAMGIPTIGTDIVGLRDAVVDGVTGLLVPAKNVDALAQGLNRLIENAVLRQEMGTRAQARVHQRFDSRQVIAAVLKEYDRLIKLDSKHPASERDVELL